MSSQSMSSRTNEQPNERTGERTGERTTSQRTSSQTNEQPTNEQPTNEGWPVARGQPRFCSQYNRKTTRSNRRDDQVQSALIGKMTRSNRRDDQVQAVHKYQIVEIGSDQVRQPHYSSRGFWVREGGRRGFRPFPDQGPPAASCRVFTPDTAI